jgi:hypothetical protein
MTTRIESNDAAGQWLDELRVALDVEPSSELQARVRSRIRVERIRSGVTSARLAGFACVAAVASFALTHAARRPTEMPSPATAPVTGVAEIAPVTKRSIASTLAATDRRAAVRPARSTGATAGLAERAGRSEPEVIVSDDQREGLRRILGALADGRRLPAIDAAIEPLEALPEPAPIGIEPLRTTPLPGTPDISNPGRRPR